MNVKSLRNSILKFAMQGKLVEQNSNDTSVEKLLNEIKEERTKRIQEKKKGQVITEDYKDKESFIYEIPNSWKWVTFGEVTFNRDYERIPLSKAQRESHFKKKYDYYGASGVIDKVDNYIFDETLLLIGEDGANLLNRSTPIAFLAHGQYWVNNHAHVVGAINQILLEYLMYYINSISLAPFITGSAQPKMNQKKLNSIPVPLPPIEEQQRIIDKIRILETQIEIYGKLYEENKVINERFPGKLEKSILQYAMQGKLVAQYSSEESASILLKKIKKEKKELIKKKIIKKEKEVTPITDKEIPHEIPSSWEWVRIKEVYYNEGQKTPDKEFCYIDVGCIDNKTGLVTDSYNTLSPEKAPSRARKIVKKGNVIYSTVRPYLQNIAIVNRLFEYETIASTAFVVINPIHIDNKYLFYVLRSPYFNSLVESKMIGATYPAINDTSFNNLVIPVPPLEEQKRIVVKIEELLFATKKLQSAVSEK